MMDMIQCRRVALIGLDGSGKSANINKMKTDPMYSKYNFIWVRWKPVLLAPAYWFMTKKIRNSKINPEEIRQTDQPQKLSKEQRKMSAEYNKKTG